VTARDVFHFTGLKCPEADKQDAATGGWCVSTTNPSRVTCSACSDRVAAGIRHAIALLDASKADPQPTHGEAYRKHFGRGEP
jgi:hypothetical protein